MALDIILFILLFIWHIFKNFSGMWRVRFIRVDRDHQKSRLIWSRNQVFIGSIGILANRTFRMKNGPQFSSWKYLVILIIPRMTLQNGTSSSKKVHHISVWYHLTKFELVRGTCYLGTLCQIKTSWIWLCLVNVFPNRSC